MPESAMHATTDPAEIAGLLPSQPRSDSALTALYGAALGPVNASAYLPVFARFDATGRTTTSWNWAASLCTLSWLVFRQLWGAALVYVAAAEGLALLVFGVGRPLLQWPQAVEWGVVAAFFLLSCAVPGLYGNALLHADTHKKIARALTATRTLNQACTLLARQASSWKRLAWLAAGNLALALAAAAAYLVMPVAGAQDSAGPLPPAVATLPVVTAPEVPSVATTPAAPPQPADHPPAQPVAPAPSVMESSEAAAPPADPAPVQAPSALAASAPGATSALAPASAPSAASPTAQAPRGSAPAIRPPPSPTEASSPGTTALPPDTAASATGSEAPPAVGTAAGYYINVGLFAEEANARKAQARLLNEGLPAFRQELGEGTKRRLRVRVGPFVHRADADAAARTIRAMGLEAAVIRLGV